MSLFNKTKNTKNVTVYSPVDGKVKDLSTVKDPVFSKGMLGPGIAVTPSSDVITSPVEGKIITDPTAQPHAFGIKTMAGPELLVHVGIDTVNLKGEGFTLAAAKEGTKLKVGDKLVDVDFATIKKSIVATDVMILVPDGATNFEIEMIAKNGDKVNAGDPLFNLVQG